MKIPTRKSSNTGSIFFQICNETAYNDMKYAKECARCKRVLIEPNFLSIQSMIIMQKSAKEWFLLSGQVVSTKREELDHMMDQFNIQVDNPVSVLTQDTSRNFLHSKSPAHKYQVQHTMVV